MKNSNKNIYFKQIFEALQQGSVIVKKHQHKLDEGEYNKRTFAEKLGTHSGVVPAILNGERNVTERIITNLCRYFNVNEAYIRMGEGGMFANNKAAEPSFFGAANILFSAVHATAGDHISDEAVAEQDIRFGIPGLQGNLFAFNVKGNSMEPLLQEGDMVFCRHVENPKYLRKDEIYAVYAEGQVRIKYIEMERDTYEPQLKLISHNSVEHPPIYVNANQGVKIYQVVHFLTDMGNRLGLL